MGEAISLEDGCAEGRRVMDLDELETHARAAAEASAKVSAADGVYQRFDAIQAALPAWEDWRDFGEDVVALIARVRAAEAERDRLRALFDAAGAGEHDVLALVDHYQLVAMAAVDERDEAYPRALQAAAGIVMGATGFRTPERREWLVDSILELSAAQIDAYAAQQAKAHGAEGGER